MGKNCGAFFNALVFTNALFFFPEDRIPFFLFYVSVTFITNQRVNIKKMF